jgi:hypothetical protein
MRVIDPGQAMGNTGFHSPVSLAGLGYSPLAPSATGSGSEPACSMTTIAIARLSDARGLVRSRLSDSSAYMKFRGQFSWRSPPRSVTSGDRRGLAPGRAPSPRTRPAALFRWGADAAPAPSIHAIPVHGRRQRRRVPPGRQSSAECNSPWPRACATGGASFCPQAARCPRITS